MISPSEWRADRQSTQRVIVYSIRCSPDFLDQNSVQAVLILIITSDILCSDGLSQQFFQLIDIVTGNDHIGFRVNTERDQGALISPVGRIVLAQLHSKQHSLVGSICLNGGSLILHVHYK